MTEDERAKLRQESHTALQALRTDPSVSEREFRLWEIVLARLDRLETGSFPSEETPTAPEVRTRKSSGAIPAFRAAVAELEKGKENAPPSRGKEKP